MLLGSAAVAAVLFAVAPTGTPGGAAGFGDAPRPRTIVGGEITEPGEFEAVVSYLYRERFCTGTLVAPRLVLTAAHCLANLPPSAAEELQVRLGPATSAPQRVVQAVSLGAHPDFCSSCVYDRIDVGFIELAEDVEVAGGYPIVITDQDDWDMVMGKGRPMTMVGYGQVESGRAVIGGDDKGLGVKRVVDTTMRAHGDSGLDFLAGAHGVDTCDGDSGGPALVRLEDGSWAVAGVLSGGLSDCGQGDSLYSVPLPALPWIRDQTGINLLPRGCGNAQCVDTYFPDDDCACRSERRSPSAWWVCVLVLGVLVRRRGRAGRAHPSRANASQAAAVSASAGK